MWPIPLLLAIAGIVLFAAEIVILVRDGKAKRVPPKSVRRWGLVLGFASLFVFYPVDERTVVFGVPFPSYAFQKVEGGWADFIGPLSLPATVLNFLVAFWLPRVYEKWWERKRRQSP